MKYYFISIAFLILLFLSIQCGNRIEPKPRVIYQKPDNLAAKLVERPPNEQGYPVIAIELSNLPKDAKPLEMVRIPPGEFMMGLSEDEIVDDMRIRKDDHKFHKVSITKPFYLGKYEITQAQIVSVMGVNPSEFKKDINNPVETVNFHHMKMFVEKMNELDVGTFRLPTEAEWEYACRAGTQTRFYFGDAPECIDKEYSKIADQHMWWGGNLETAMRGPMPVGLKLSNSFGLYDMHANVYEWCSDRYGPYPGEPRIDPKGHPTNKARVFRGGPWNGKAQWCQSGRRNLTSPNNSYHWLGIRLVREVE